MFIVFTDMSRIKAIRSFPTEAEMDGYCARYMEIAPEDTIDHQVWRETHNMPALVVFKAENLEAIDTWRDIEPFAIYLAGKRWDCVLRESGE